jgi:hypothetical protein
MLFTNFSVSERRPAVMWIRNDPDPKYYVIPDPHPKTRPSEVIVGEILSVNVKVAGKIFTH